MPSLLTQHARKATATDVTCLRADISCISGCTCATTRLAGHWGKASSGTWSHPFTVSQSRECVLRILVLAEEDGGTQVYEQHITSTLCFQLVF